MRLSSVYKWTYTSLGKVANVIDPHPSHRAPAVAEIGVPFAGIGDIDEFGNIDTKSARVVSKNIFEDQKRHYELTKFSIGYGRVGTVGKVVSLLDRETFQYTLSPTLCVINYIPNEVDPNFLRCIIESVNFNKQALSKVTGSTRPTIGIQEIRNLIVPITEKAYQTEIGNKWRFFTSKIQTNCLSISNLYEQAFSIVKNFLTNKGTNGVLNDIVLQNNKSKFTVNSARGVNGKYPFFTSGKSVLKYEKFLVDGFNIFLNTGGMADVKQFFGKASYSTDTWCIKGTDNYSEYLFVILKNMQIELDRNYFEGSALRHLQKKKLLQKEIYIPTSEEIIALNKLLTPIFMLINNLISQNDILSKMRVSYVNEILPKNWEVDY